MTGIDLETVRERWDAERPLYREFATHIESIMEEAARTFSIPCRIEARTKEMDSLLKKIVKKQYNPPFERVGDKVGARLVVYSADFLPAAVGAIERTFDILDVEDTADRLDLSAFGYRGMHLQVKLPDDLLSNGREKFEGLQCEIQVATMAQRLWGDLEHRMVYKPGSSAPDEVRRTFSRLAALMEIFDSEVERAKSMMLRQPGYEEGTLLAGLEHHYYSFTAREPDRELSLIILGGLKDLLSSEEVATFELLLATFVTTQKRKLQDLFRDYANDSRCTPLLFQPESLFIFWRLQTDQFSLKEKWGEFLPEAMLGELQAIWGVW